MTGRVRALLEEIDALVRPPSAGDDSAFADDQLEL